MRLGSGFSKGARTFPLTPVQSWFIGPGHAPIRRGHSIIATVISWRTLGSKADTARPPEGQKDFFSQGRTLYMPNYTEVQVPLRLRTIECDGARALQFCPLGTVRHPAPDKAVVDRLLG